MHFTFQSCISHFRVTVAAAAISCGEPKSGCGDYDDSRKTGKKPIEGSI